MVLLRWVNTLSYHTLFCGYDCQYINNLYISLPVYICFFGPQLSDFKQISQKRIFPF